MCRAAPLDVDARTESWSSALIGAHYLDANLTERNANRRCYVPAGRLEHRAIDDVFLARHRAGLLALLWSTLRWRSREGRRVPPGPELIDGDTQAQGDRRFDTA